MEKKNCSKRHTCIAFTCEFYCEFIYVHRSLQALQNMPCMHQHCHKNLLLLLQKAGKKEATFEKLEIKSVIKKMK